MKKLRNNLQRVLKAAQTHSKQIPALCSLEYVALVKQKIITQNFAFPFKSLGKVYTVWKGIHYPSAKTFWHLSGDLHRSIQSIQISPTAFAGTIPASIMDSGHKSYGRTSATSILKYAMALENGADWMQNGKSQHIAARPLFWPTALEYEANGYQKHLTKAVSALKKGWRK